MEEIVDLTVGEDRNYNSTVIKVVGVGGAGCNAVSNMYEEGISGVEYIICNTDVQCLDASPIEKKVPLGVMLTEGRGAGNMPEQGKQAAIENIEDIRRAIGENTNMIFITAGMGGGTGTGATPVVAELAREMGILTIAVLSIPSPKEGNKRYRQALDGVEKMRKHVDSMLVISNEKLHKNYGSLPASKAFKEADGVITTAVKGVAEIITLHGAVNVDFSDVNTVMENSEVFIMGTGYASGENRAKEAVNQALESPLLDSNDIYGAKDILLNIVSGNVEVTMDEIGEIQDLLQYRSGDDADIIWGEGRDENLGDQLSVTVVATRFDTNPSKVVQEQEVERVKLEVNEQAAQPVKPKVQREDPRPRVEVEERVVERIPLHEEEEKPRRTVKKPNLAPKTKAPKEKKEKGFGWIQKNLLGGFFDDDDGEDMVD